jgi:hypothetical protein
MFLMLHYRLGSALSDTLGDRRLAVEATLLGGDFETDKTSTDAIWHAVPSGLCQSGVHSLRMDTESEGAIAFRIIPERLATRAGARGAPDIAIDLIA